MTEPASAPAGDAARPGTDDVKVVVTGASDQSFPEDLRAVRGETAGWDVLA